MSVLRVLVVVAGLGAGLVPALAATAHNSQAGAFGPNKHPCAPTPYFPEGGCFTSFLTGRDDGWVAPRQDGYDQERYDMERRPLRPLDR